MPLYLLYPTKDDGVATGFEATEFSTDAVAIADARRLLAEHASAARIEIWHARRHVGTRRRCYRQA